MFAKHMTPLKVHGKSSKRVAHKGKGSTEQTDVAGAGGGDRQTLTEGEPMDRMMNQYGKQDPTAASEAPSPVEAMDVA